MYIPKSKSKINLYTNGGEFLLAFNLIDYIGSYWSTYNGEFFTGKTPFDKPSFKLILKNNPQLSPENSTFLSSKIAIFDYVSTVDEKLSQSINFELVSDYLKLKNINQNNSKELEIPKIYFYSPTESDYKLGEIQRYFCKRSNQNIYIEISKEYFDKLINKDSLVLYTLYIPISIPWQISGDKASVLKTNFNIVKQAELKQNLPGLSKYLDDYLKFYRA
jgi:hypothetical protein